MNHSARSTAKPTSPRPQARKHAGVGPDPTRSLEVVHARAAGIDVGNRTHYVAVPPHLDAQPVRQFGCFTADLEQLRDWLLQLGITSVVLQSTSVYWVPLYDILTEAGLEVFLVNARDTKNLPGRKTDVQECQWLLKLHTFGLLRRSFRPTPEMLPIRCLWRHRKHLVAEAARCVQHMQKALTEMNLQLANVISDLSGKTGQAIVQAILAGERNPEVLSRLRDPRIKADRLQVEKSLHGHWKDEQLFLLQQAFDSHQHFEQQMESCDQALERLLKNLPEKADPEQLPACPRNKRPRGNAPQKIAVREQLYRISGVDLTAIDGINVMTALTVVAEVGLDMSRFPNEGNFVSWLNLAPAQQVTGGKVIGRDKRKVVNRAGQALRDAATTLLRSDSYLGAEYRRFRLRLEGAVAVKAMAGKLARIIYRMLKYGEAFVNRGTAQFEERHRQRQLAALHRQAEKLGLTLVQNTGVA